MMTGESYSTVPSPTSNVGILPSGLIFISSRCGVVPPVTVRTVRMRSCSPISWIAIMTLRT